MTNNASPLAPAGDKAHTVGATTADLSTRRRSHSRTLRSSDASSSAEPVEELAEADIDRLAVSPRRASIDSRSQGAQSNASSSSASEQPDRNLFRRGSGQMLNGIPLALESPRAAAAGRTPVFPLRKGPVFPIVQQTRRLSQPDAAVNLSLPTDDLSTDAAKPTPDGPRRVASRASLSSLETTNSSELYSQFPIPAMNSRASTPGFRRAASVHSSVHSAGDSPASAFYAPSIVSIPASSTQSVAGPPQSIFANPAHQRRPIADLLPVAAATTKKKFGLFSRSKSAPATASAVNDRPTRGGSAAVLSAALASSQGWPSSTSAAPSSASIYSSTQRRSSSTSSISQSHHSSSLQSAILRAQANLGQLPEDSASPVSPRVESGDTTSGLRKDVFAVRPRRKGSSISSGRVALVEDETVEAGSTPPGSGAGTGLGIVGEA